MSYILQFFLIVILQSIASAKVTVQSTLCRHHIKTSEDSLFYNGMFFTAVSVLLFIFFPKAPLDSQTLLWGIASGLLTLMFQVFYSIALSMGPVSITVLIINFNILIPTAISAVVYHENLYVSQLFGILLLFISMVLSTKEDASSSERKMSKLWLLLTVIACLSTAFSTVIMNFYAKTSASAVQNSSNTFLIVMYAAGAVLTFLAYFVRSHTGKRNHITFKLGKSIYLYALSMGVIMTFFQKFNVFCMSNIDGSFMFPMQSGVSAIMMTAIGIAIFKDRLSLRQLVGVICGILCVVFLNIRVGAYITL